MNVQNNANRHNQGFLSKVASASVNLTAAIFPRTYVGSFFFPKETNIPTVVDTFGTTTLRQFDNAQELRTKVGPKLSRQAANTGRLVESKIRKQLGQNQKEAPGTPRPDATGEDKTVTAKEKLKQAAYERIDDLPRDLVETLVKPELLILQVLESTQSTLESTNLQQLGESLQVVTDFLTRYRQVFAELSLRKFESAQEEELAWKDMMGDYWLPMMSLDVNQGQIPRVAMVKFFEDKINRLIDHILVKGRFVLTIAPGAQEGLVRGIKKFFNYKFSSAINNPEGETFFHGIARAALVLAERESIYRTAHTPATKLLRKVVADYGYQLPDAAVTPLEDHQILTETICSKQRVFHCSQRAARLGIRVGMEATVAAQLWNGANTGIDAQILTEEDDRNTSAFHGRKGLKESIRIPLEALLSQTTPQLKQAVLDKCGAAKPLLRALFWIAEVSLKGLNLFVGIPSAKVLAEEIASNLVKHIENPAIVAVPFLLIDRLMDIIEGKMTPANNASNSDREAFIGELVIEVGKTIATLCPSLFKWRFPRLVSGIGNASLWAVRKGVALTGLAIVNPITRKIASLALKCIFRKPEDTSKKILVEKVLYWIQSSSLTLLGSKNGVKVAHTILSYGYKMAGEYGVVPKDQSHFERADKSLAHLIHHTVLAVLRIAPKFVHKNFEGIELICTSIKSKVAKGEPLSAEELKLLRNFITKKVQTNQEQLAWLPIIETQFLTIRKFLAEPADINKKIDEAILHLRKNQKQFSAIIHKMFDTVDEASPAYIYYHEQIQTLITDLTNLKLSTDIIKLSDSQRKTYVGKLQIVLRKQNQLQKNMRSFIEAIAQEMLKKNDEYTREINNIEDPAIIAKWTDRILYYVNTATIAKDRYLKERALFAELEDYAHEFKESLEQQDQLVEDQLKFIDLQDDFNRAKAAHLSKNEDLIEEVLTVAEEARAAEESRKAEEASRTVKSRFASLINPFNRLQDSSMKSINRLHDASIRPIHWLKGWNDDNLSTQNVLDQIDFYRPGRSKQLKEKQMKLLVQMHFVSKELMSLSSVEETKPLVADVLWLLEASGKDLVKIAKRVIPENAIPRMANVLLKEPFPQD